MELRRGQRPWQRNWKRKRMVLRTRQRQEQCEVLGTFGMLIFHPRLELNGII